MFAGSMVALITPMDSDDSVNHGDLEKLIDFHVAAGTEALIIAGTTGESATLSRVEHIEVIQTACRLAAGRLPIIAGTGSNSTSQTLDLSRSIDSFDVAAFLLVTPYYNKPTQEGMYRHFCTVADAVERPVILYNVPSRTAVDLQNDTVIRLSKHGNIVGIKDASGDMGRVEPLREGCGSSFSLLSGDDATSCEFMLRGGDGVISVTGNVAPAAMRRLCDTARAGDRAAAEKIDADLRGLHSALFVESNPIPVKWSLQQMGLCGGGIRLPLTPLGDRHHATVGAAMKQAGIEAKGID